MKTQTSELTGAALDWAVAKCEGATDFWFDTAPTFWVKLDGKDRALRYGWAQSYLPSTDWAQAGPIIEREGIELVPSHDGTRWYSEGLNRGGQSQGPTPLIAAMRCYVASKIGNEVDVPNELGESK